MSARPRVFPDSFRREAKGVGRIAFAQVVELAPGGKG